MLSLTTLPEPCVIDQASRLPVSMRDLTRNYNFVVVQVEVPPVPIAQEGQTRSRNGTRASMVGHFWYMKDKVRIREERQNGGEDVVVISLSESASCV